MNALFGGITVAPARKKGPVVQAMRDISQYVSQLIYFKREELVIQILWSQLKARDHLTHLDRRERLIDMVDRQYQKEFKDERSGSL